MTRAYLALGSNLGDRAAYLQGAVDELGATTGVRVVAVSPVYETVPVGGPAQDDYLNAVVAIDTDLDPWQLLARRARVRGARAARARPSGSDRAPSTSTSCSTATVQMDDPALTIPHPRMWERGFVLAPLRDVAPDTRATPVQIGGPDVRVSSVALEVPPDP